MNQKEARIRKLIREELKRQLNEVDYAEVKIPGGLTKFLDKFTDTMKKINLNKNQQTAIVFNILKGLDVDYDELTYMYKKLKNTEINS